MNDPQTRACHIKELEVLKGLAESAKAPRITYSESVDVMRQRAHSATRELLEEVTDRLDGLIAGKPL